MVTEVMDRMKEFKKIVDGKYELQDDLLSLMREKFPLLKEVYFTEDSFQISTGKHTMRASSWRKEDECKFVCDNPVMPDTPEQFIEMKKQLEEDKRQCMTAYFWLKFRYKI